MPKHIEVFPRFDPGQLTFEPISTFQYQGDLAQALAQGLSPEEAWRMLDCMLYIRLFEEMNARVDQQVIEMIFKFTLPEPVLEAPAARPAARAAGPVLGGPAPMATPPKKMGRNDPCPCGSGKKYKKCHGV